MCRLLLLNILVALRSERCLYIIDIILFLMVNFLCLSLAFSFLSLINLGNLRLVSIIGHVIEPHQNINGRGIVLGIMKRDEGKLFKSACACFSLLIIAINEEFLRLAVAGISILIFLICVRRGRSCRPKLRVANSLNLLAFWNKNRVACWSIEGFEVIAKGRETLEAT